MSELTITLDLQLISELLDFLCKVAPLFLFPLSIYFLLKEK